MKLKSFGIKISDCILCADFVVTSCQFRRDAWEVSISFVDLSKEIIEMRGAWNNTGTFLIRGIWNETVKLVTRATTGWNVASRTAASSVRRENPEPSA